MLMLYDDGYAVHIHDDDTNNDTFFPSVPDSLVTLM
jgi:hypothetical protein